MGLIQVPDILKATVDQLYNIGNACEDSAFNKTWPKVYEEVTGKRIEYKRRRNDTDEWRTHEQWTTDGLPEEEWAKAEETSIVDDVHNGPCTDYLLHVVHDIEA